MNVKELIELLKEQDPEATVWVDWDREGDNEDEVRSIEPFNRHWLDKDSTNIKLTC